MPSEQLVQIGPLVEVEIAGTAVLLSTAVPALALPHQ